MKIKMLETRMGTEDGHLVRQFNKDEVYDITNWLACEFMNSNSAIKVGGNDNE